MHKIPTNLHHITDTEAVRLCSNLRTRLVDIVSQTGGHLASNLGVIELTVALHRVFSPEHDRILFDVGHQCYCHKMLTGRNGVMDTLRTLGGLSGFPKPAESICDPFIAGHASTAVSVAVGMARARTIKKEKYRVVAILGDGALTGGLAYEGLSNAGSSGEPLMVILNDNGMSITKNVGSIAEYLARQRLKPPYLNFKKRYRRVMQSFSLGRHIYRITHKIKNAIKGTLLPCSFFENMGFTYLGPVDGHDVIGLTKLMRYAKEIGAPVLLHVRTVKGKGYPPAESDPERFHGVGKFDPQTGEPVHAAEVGFSTAFGSILCRLAEKDKTICAVTAAMCPGTGLHQFAKQFPKRFFDVGIAEGHAVTMCAGMAKQGLTPIFAVYSTFLQRAYDMLIHDVALQKLHVILCVDRAGLVGEDGETHQGVFDVGFLDSIPGMTLFAPSNYAELEDMLSYAIYKIKGPVAIRYPRGGEGAYKRGWEGTPVTTLRTGKDLMMVGYGVQINALLTAADRLETDGISVGLVKLNMLSPTPTDFLLPNVQNYKNLYFYEECMDYNCVGRRFTSSLAMSGMTIPNIVLWNLGRTVPPQGPVRQLEFLCGLDADSVVENIRRSLLE